MFLTRVLGVWLFINGMAYVVASFTGVLLPQYEDQVSNMAFSRHVRGSRFHVVDP